MGHRHAATIWQHYASFRARAENRCRGHHANHHSDDHSDQRAFDGALRVDQHTTNDCSRKRTGPDQAKVKSFESHCLFFWLETCCRHPLNTSVVEGINNTIKVIKRKAYGYRDEEYFFLKIRDAFPGNPR